MALTEAGNTAPDKELGGIPKFTADQKRKLKAFVASIEHAEKEIEEASAGKNDIYEAVEEAGFNTKMVKRVIKARKKSKQERDYENEVFDFYMAALGDADAH
jgi:uncharacterized protein (UPF0335 family)